MKRKNIAIPYIIWLAGFIILPLLVITYYAFTTSEGSFTLENVFAIFSNVHRSALFLSLQIAFGTTAVCLLLAYPLALALRKLKISKKGFMIIVLILPMWMNFILRVLAWQMILSKNGILNSLLGQIGIAPLEIVNTPIAVLIGMVYDFLPYMILPIYTAVSEVSEDLIEAARDLGAGSILTLLRIMLPLTRGGIVSGIIMVFVPSMTAFVVSDILGGGKILLLGNVIEQEFVQGMNWNLGSGLSFALMVIALLGMFLSKEDEVAERGAKIW